MSALKEAWQMVLASGASAVFRPFITHGLFSCVQLSGQKPGRKQYHWVLTKGCFGNSILCVLVRVRGSD